MWTSSWLINRWLSDIVRGLMSKIRILSSRKTWCATKSAPKTPVEDMIGPTTPTIKFFTRRSKLLVLRNCPLMKSSSRSPTISSTTQESSHPNQIHKYVKQGPYTITLNIRQILVIRKRCKWPFRISPMTRILQIKLERNIVCVGFFRIFQKKLLNYYK